MARFMLEFHATPNPNARKYVLPKGAEAMANPAPEPGTGGAAGGGTGGAAALRSYRSAAQADGDVLARALFGVPGVCGVLVGDGWVTVNKTPETRWGEVESGIAAIFRRRPGA